MAIGDTTANDGTVIDLDSAPTTLVWAGDELSYIQVVASGKTFRKTFTYLNGKVAGITGWIKQ